LDVTRADFAFGPGQSSNAVPAPPRGPAVSNVPIASGGAFAALVKWRLTPLLLLASLMLAFLFGAVHALGPGHGQTITAALAVAGGILPSPTAFVVLAGSISAHRLGYGLVLVGAFSLGLAGALILVGLLALRARAVVAGRLNGRLAVAVPLLSAMVIVGFGVFFAARGLSQLA